MTHPLRLNVMRIIEEERHAHTLKALADVNAGRLVDHEAVKAWATGLITSAYLKPG